MYSLRDASTLLGCDVRTLARCLHDASISPAPGRTDRRRLELTAEQLDAVRPLVAERTQRNASTAAASRPSSGDGHADLAAIRAEVAALRARVASLERMVRTPIAAVTRSQAADVPDVPAYVPMPYKAPVDLLSASDGHSRVPVDANGFPSSMRGRSRWVEQHGGPRASYVRDWPDVPQWTCEADAIASVRRHNGWADWTPS